MKIAVDTEKLFKYFTVFLSLLLVLSIFLATFSYPSVKGIKINLDLFQAEFISENIKNMEMNMTSVIYVKNKKNKWVEYHRIHGEENRLWISIDQMPKDLINAFIAIEDETFYEHDGINWRRTVGAVSNYIFKFDDTEFGGSTITQQLIKNVTLDAGKNASRKLREIVRAMLIEKKLSKTQILEAYLNTIALGNGICGVQVAANYYFNKDVSELTLPECATIAAITKNPSKYNPITGEKENQKRRNVVLKKMLQLGFIKASQMLDNYDVEINLDNTQKKEYEPEINNYFVDTLIEQVIADLMEKYDCSEDMASTMLYNGGFKIYSTVNPEIQEAMENVYLDIDKYFPYKGEDLKGKTVHAQSAMTIVDYSGHIVGIVGGAGVKEVNRGLNRAYNSPRQPGSTMKPLGVYAPALEEDIIHYSSKVEDKPVPHYYSDGRSGPAEWYGYYKGTITVDYAIRKSANTIPVILLQELGINKSYKFLTQKLGMKHLTKTDKNPASLALGGCAYGMTTTESAAAYAIFGNGGMYYEPKTYYKIERINGEVVLQADKKGKRAISESTATIMNHLLQGVVYGSEGTGGSIASFDHTMKAYAKTGTSSESNDLWMVAGTPYYVGSVWYGFDKQQTINSTSAAAVIWRDVMKQVHLELEPKEFEDSDDVYKKGSGYYKEGTTPDNLTLMTGDDDSSSEESTTSSKKNSSTEKDSSKKENASKNSSKESTSKTPSKESGSETPSKDESKTSSKVNSANVSSKDTTTSKDTVTSQSTTTEPTDTTVSQEKPVESQKPQDKPVESKEETAVSSEAASSEPPKVSEPVISEETPSSEPQPPVEETT